VREGAARASAVAPALVPIGIAANDAGIVAAIHDATRVRIVTVGVAIIIVVDAEETVLHH
jgi:hypothetical protein